MKKKIVFLVILAMMFSVIISACGNNNSSGDNNNTPVSVDGADVLTDDSQTEEAGPIVYKADVEAFDWEGKEFKIMVNDGDGEWRDVDFIAEEQIGEPINDAVYTRNSQIEEMFNIKIVPIQIGDRVQSVRRAVNAGDNSYDIIFSTPFNNATLSQDGMLYDLLHIPNLDFNEPWWDQNASKDLTIAHRLYMMTGDIGTMYRKSVGIILFNKQMVKDYALKDPYQLVANKTWTMDEFLSMCKDVSEDINGDGVWDDNDRFGLLGYCDIMPISLMGCGVKIATKNVDDIPELTFYNEKTVDIFNKIAEVVHNRELFWSWSRVGSNNERSRVMFANGQGLFNWNEFHSIPNLRTMDADFGILPMPLYEANQERYYHSVNPHVALMLAIPISNPDTERTGAVVQAMGAISKNVLTPAYYDISLVGKHARDDESVMTMDVIFNSVTYDPGYMYNWGNVGTFTLPMVDNFRDDVTSEYERLEVRAQTALDRMIERYLELD